MKKNFMWTMAALFVGGIALTGCSMEDNPNPKPAGIEARDLLFLDFEEGEASDYFAFGRSEATLATPETGTGRAAAIVSGSDRGDMVKTDVELTDATAYSVEMDILLNKSPKETQFAVVGQNAWEGWDGWLTNWGIFWKTNAAQVHTATLFSMKFNNSNNADLLINFDEEGKEVKLDEPFTFEDNTWYKLVLGVDIVKHTVQYEITSEDGLTLVQGTYEVPEDDSMLIKGIYWRNGRLAGTTGAIAIDNVRIVGYF